MSIVRRDEKFVADREDADYYGPLGERYIDRFKDGAREWACLFLRDFAGSRWADIAVALDRCNGESTARDVYRRAKRNLAKMMGCKA